MWRVETGIQEDEKYHKIKEKAAAVCFPFQSSSRRGLGWRAGEGKRTGLIYIRTESPIKWCVGGHALICGLRRKVVRRLQSVVARGGKFILRRPAGEMRFSLSIQLFFVTLHLPLLPPFPLSPRTRMRHLPSVTEKPEINH